MPRLRRSRREEDNDRGQAPMPPYEAMAAALAFTPPPW